MSCSLQGCGHDSVMNGYKHVGFRESMIRCEKTVSID